MNLLGTSKTRIAIINRNTFGKIKTYLCLLDILTLYSMLLEGIGLCFEFNGIPPDAIKQYGL